MPTNPNKKLLEELRILADFYKRNGEPFRARAYSKAIMTIENLDYKLKTKEQAMKLDGIGKGIAEKIQEFATSRKINKVKRVQKEDILIKKRMGPQLKVVNTFEKIWGVGPVKAKKL